MNQSTNEIFGETLNTTWIENLALQELNMDESGVIDFSDHLDPSIALEESSIEVMDQIRDLIEFYITKFNEYRGSNGQIKIFKISNTVNDFMLFRNSLRLVFTRQANDLITIGFMANGQDLYSTRLPQNLITENSQEGRIGGHDIRAMIGPFGKITWTFQGDPVDLEAMTKHYISEFLKNSSR